MHPINFFNVYLKKKANFLQTLSYYSTSNRENFPANFPPLQSNFHAIFDQPLKPIWPHPQPNIYRILINTTRFEARDNVLRLPLNDRVMQMSVAGLSEDLRNTESESRSTGR